MRKTALILAPHPDDECITGLLPLRLQAECGFRVFVIPATLGSRVVRQVARMEELKSACAVLGFQVRFLKSNAGSADRRKELGKLFASFAPALVFMPHARDGHPTHRATHQQGVAAMDAMPGCVFHVVETEYWHPLERPNLMVAASKAQLATLRKALACHKGELARNDYAARLPAWMIDNVRRGAELIGGAGSAAPAIPYATLYRARRRANGTWSPDFRGGKMIKSENDLCGLSARWV